MNTNKKQMLVRILTGQATQETADTDIAYKLLEQATSRGYAISKLKIHKATNNNDVKVVIFEVVAKNEERFPGCFRIHRKSQFDVYYTMNALLKAKESYENEDAFFAENSNKLITMLDNVVVEYCLETTTAYVRENEQLIKL